MTTDYITNEDVYRYSTDPIKLPEIWNFYKVSLEMFWTPVHVENELVNDASNWSSIPEHIQKFIIQILAFFLVSDGVVGEILQKKILNRMKAREVLTYYNYQIMMEDIHNTVYSLLMKTYITDINERDKLFKVLENNPAIKAKVSWIKKWVGKSSSCSNEQHIINVDENCPLDQIIITNIITEGLFFSGSFCAIFWINQHPKYLDKLPGLAQSNEWISRDEGLHTEFGILIRKYISDKLPESQVHKMMKEAVKIEKQFITTIIQKPDQRMNKKLMTQYIQFVADGLLKDMGYSMLYKVENPFDFMIKQSVGIRITDFFNNDVSDYGIHKNDKLCFNEDF